MVTVKDLVEKLKEYPEDMPVYWGERYFPPECCDSKTIVEFPVELLAYYTWSLIPEEHKVFHEYLYFGDPKDVKMYRDNYRNLKREWETKNLLGYIKYWVHRHF